MQADALRWLDAHVTSRDTAAAVELTRQLIRCKPCNPPGDERAPAQLAADALRQAGGFAVEVQEFAPGRCNLLATFGDPDDIALILNGHLDVVPIFGDWTHEHGALLDGVVHGRGSADMLGGCAAILTAAGCIARSGLRPRRGFQVILVGDEEDKNRGILHILSQKKLRAEAAVIAEPTGMEIHLGNRGFSSFYLTTHGKACHASRPENGVNAIYKMAHAIAGIEAYAESLSAVTDPYLGRATACVGTVQGGIRLNTVPDRCVAEVERRLLPGETLDSVRAQIASAAGPGCEVTDRTFFPASLIDRNHALIRDSESLLGYVLGRTPEIAGFPACTEASMFSVRCGIPTAIIGPGAVTQAHTVNESCPAHEISDCTRFFAALLYSRIA